MDAGSSIPLNSYPYSLVSPGRGDKVGIRQIDLSEETLALINQLRKMHEAGQVFEHDQRLKHSDELDSMLAQVAHAFGSDVSRVADIEDGATEVRVQPDAMIRASRRRGCYIYVAYYDLDNEVCHYGGRERVPECYEI
jgi:hypothetical protein